MKLGETSRDRWALVRLIGRPALPWTAAILVFFYSSFSSTTSHTKSLLRQQARLFWQLAATAEQEFANQPDAAGALRQISARLAAREGTTFRLIGGSETPDDWEKNGLAALQQGRLEEFGFSNDKKSFRYIAPLRVESSQSQLAISVSVPATSYLLNENEEHRRVTLVFAFIWMLGLAAAAAGAQRLLKKQLVAEDALRAASESEERFRRLFEEAPIAYHEIDANGVIVRVNQAECALLGFERAQMLGRPIWDFVAPEDRARSQAAVHAKVSGRQPLVPFQRDYLHQDGTPRRLEIHERLIYHAGRDSGDHSSRSVSGIRSTLLDVTDRERTQRELQQRTEELARSNAELEQFAYVASHDLQEPLRKITAFGDRLHSKCGPALGEQGLDYLERMMNASRRMQQLINDLLTFSRIKTKADPLAPVNLTQVVRGVLSDLEVRVEQLGAQVELDSLPTVKADSMQMSQLFLNLIGNALKFHRSDSTPAVRITSRAHAMDTGQWCEVLVQDNGIGFEEKYCDRIFQVFQRLHGRTEYEGTGIGLAVCRRIAERHGGTITAHSMPGQGATFVVTLPLLQESRNQ